MKSLRSRRSFLLLALFVVSVATGADTPTAGSRPDPWKPLRILIGQWEGDVQGESGKGKAEREYRFVLNNRFIHVANKSIYPAQEKSRAKILRFIRRPISAAKNEKYDKASCQSVASVTR